MITLYNTLYCLISQRGVTNSKSVIIEGASHCVGLDEPEKVNEAIQQFLKDYESEDM